MELITDLLTVAAQHIVIGLMLLLFIGPLLSLAVADISELFDMKAHTSAQEYLSGWPENEEDVPEKIRPKVRELYLRENGRYQPRDRKRYEKVYSDIALINQQYCRKCSRTTSMGRIDQRIQERWHGKEGDRPHTRDVFKLTYYDLFECAICGAAKKHQTKEEEFSMARYKHVYGGPLDRRGRWTLTDHGQLAVEAEHKGGSLHDMFGYDRSTREADL